MTSDSSPRPDVARQLGVLAMRFRRTRDEAVRRAVAAEYAREVQRLIETGSWAEAPAVTACTHHTLQVLARPQRLPPAWSVVRPCAGALYAVPREIARDMSQPS